MVHSGTIVSLVMCISLPLQVPAESSSISHEENETSGVVITLSGLQITDAFLKVRYCITNNSSEDVWLCDDLHVVGQKFEVYLTEDGQTLMIRRRFAVPQEMIWTANPMVSYLRLCSGESRSESLSLTLPVGPTTIFTREGNVEGIVYATRIVLEIGFHPGDLLREVLEDVGGRSTNNFEPSTIRSWLSFVEMNERLVDDRHEQLVFWWPSPVQDRESVLRIAADGQRIPYAAEYPRSRRELPNLTSYTRIDVVYQPSMLQFFLPHANQQSLLSSGEKMYLQSQKKELIKEQDRIDALADHLRRNYNAHVTTVSRGPAARIACYHDDDQSASLALHYPNMVELKDGQSIRCWDSFGQCEALAPMMRPFEIRFQCTRNLESLWYRLRIHHRIQNDPLGSARGSRMAYPPPREWCDALMVFRNAGNPQKRAISPWACPSEGSKDAHYAMNPDCRFDSPADTVLLFETKAGWNQHGGPELFTFDNHDPKGGCVLLNGGTVKFIRTEEELKQLRWK